MKKKNMRFNRNVRDLKDWVMECWVDPYRTVSFDKI